MTKHVGNRYIIITAFTLFASLFLFFSIYHQSDSSLLFVDDSVLLNSDWQVQHDGLYVNTALPTDVGVTKGGNFSISRELPDTPDTYNHLLIRASLQDITVTLDGQILHQKAYEEATFFTTPLTSTWELVTLPSGYQGKTLTIDVLSQTQAFSGVINPIYIGSSAALLFQVIETNWLGLFISILLICMAILSFIFAFTYRVFSDNRLIYVALLSLSAGMWILGESKLLQFFTSNPFIIGAMPYLVIPLIGAFFTLYVKEAVSVCFSKGWTFAASIQVFFTLMMLILQQFGFFHMIEMLPMILAIILFLAFVQLAMLLYEWKRTRSEAIKQFFKYLLVIVCSLLLEAVLFYSASFQMISSISRFGFLIFFALISYDAYRYLRETAKRERDNRTLKTLAYQDFLTAGFNRTAYDRDSKRLVNNQIVFRLVLIDLNGLKQINDKYGHDRGDQAIVSVYQAIQAALEGKGTCYRIGGDEFVIISEILEDDLFLQFIDTLRERIVEEGERLQLPLDVAVGSDVYNTHSAEDYNEFYHYVDQLMYLDKSNRKKMTLS